MGLIGSAIGAVGSIFGGISASKAMRKAKENVEKQMKENQDWYDRRYNEDATQRADAQAVWTRLEDNIKKRNKATAGAQAVTGGTDESVAAAKEANNEAIANATSQIAADGANRKDVVEGQYNANKTGLNNQLNNIEVNKAKAISQAVSGLANAAGDLDFGTKNILGKNIDL